MEAGRLRHRIDIDDRVTVQDGTGDPVATWVPWATNVPAEIVPLSVKEFIAASTQLGQVTARIVIRWRAGLAATMRLRHGADVYSIVGALPDPESGREYVTLAVTRGTNLG